jgi:hypothetical protein
MGSTLMLKTPKYSAFAIAAIESIWPNNDGTEADLDLLDFAYLSGMKDLISDVQVFQPILLEDNVFDKDAFVYTVVSFFFNPEGIFLSDYNVPTEGLADILEKEANHDFLQFLNLLNQKTLEAVKTLPLAFQRYYRFSNWNFNQNKILNFTLTGLDVTNPDSALATPIIRTSQSNFSAEKSKAAEYVVELIKPTGLSSSTYREIAQYLNGYNPSKGRMQYDFIPSPSSSGLPSLREVLVNRANQLAERAEGNESLETARINNPLREGSNGLYPVSVKRPDYNNYLKTSEDAYKKRRGYFKVIPLNVVQANVRCSSSADVLSDNQFSISFTMDDVIVVADKYASSQIKNIPTALPISLNSGELNSILRGVDLETIQNAEEIATLGLSAYRISGANFPFNIEDLVETNDTVTIWLYHDPSEFDFIPSVDGSTQNEMLEAFVFNKDFSYVLGNASRKSQDESNLIGREINANQRILTDAGVLNLYGSPLTRPVLADEEKSYETVSILSSLDVLNIIKSSAEFLSLLEVNETLSPFGRFSNTDFFEKANAGIGNLTSSLFPVSADTLIRNSFSGLIKSIYIPNESLSPRTRARNAINVLNSFEEIISLVPDEKSNFITERIQTWNSLYKDKKIPGSNLTYGQVVNADDFFISLNWLRTPLAGTTNSVLEILRENNVVNVVDPQIPTRTSTGFFNKRKYVATSSHGETPYLAIKGHINSVSVSYGSTGQANKVTISGNGYEKILKENKVYYEDLFYPSTGGSFNLIEVQSIYLNMLPTNAILHFIATHAPKFIMFGAATQSTTDMRNAAIRGIASYPKLSDLDANTIEKDAEKENDGSPVTEKLVRQEEVFESDDYAVVNFIRELYTQKKVLTRGQVAVDANDLLHADGNPNGSGVQFRFFYPVNYLNTSRMREMIRLLLKAYYADPRQANILSPITISSSASIANNIATMNGDSLINHLFIDETGRLRQRITFEAWERTPNPVYTPTITDKEIISGGSSFSRSGEQVLTMVDIRPFVGGTIIGDVRFAGRALSDGNDYIPVLMTSEGRAQVDVDNKTPSIENQPNDSLSGDGDITSTLLQKNFYETLSEPFFRYGKRYRNVTRDIYAQNTMAAKRKATLLQRFFEKPVKEAKISVLGNTSYKSGETVLVSLQSYKHRSSEIVDIVKTLDWLRYLQGDEKLRDLYIGIDERFLNDDTYYLTNGTLKNRPEFFWLKDYSKEFILNKFIETFQYLNDILAVGLNKGPRYITPEFFPTTLWAFRNQNVEIANKFNKNLTNTNISQFYARIYNSLINGENSEINEFLSNYPEAINAIRFQNFRTTSYYINSVSHSFVHGSQMTTELSLTHGQDNLVLLEPFSLRPIGFISIEKRLKMGYDDIVVDAEGKPVYSNPNRQTKERGLWEDFESKTKSNLQIMYEEQFYQDKQFKESSFLYSAQKYRNSSNFMYELALELGLD